MNEDSETEDARGMAKEIDLLDISGVVDFKPFSPHDEFTDDKI
jgi:tRNA (Thr-GGU) A37 N-methylase